MNKTQLAVTALLLGSSTLLQAADESMDTIVVTATRTAQSADEALASVSVISRDEIEASQANSVMELIQSRTVGVEFSRNGGPGANTNLFIRGTEGRHVLVLIDGVRVSSAIDGSFKWHNLPLEQVERIEIVRGPRSTLYGSDAVGGVVQIFTRKGEGLHASVGGGSYKTRTAEFGAGGKMGDGRFHINAGYQKSDGFSAKQPGSYNYEPDRDGYLNRNIGAGISYPLGDAVELAVNLLHSDGEVETDKGSSTQLNDSASLKLEITASETWQHELQLGHAKDHYETESGYDVISQRQSIGWQNNLIIGDSGLLSVGLEYISENGESVGSYDHDTDSNALYLQYQWEGKHADLQVGARSDDHSVYGRHNTGQIAVGAAMGGGRLFASHGTAYKAPSFLQLYYPTYGNLELEPEESTTTEVGFRQGGLQFTLFKTRIQNLIAFDYPVGYSNINNARINGAEVEFQQQLDNWQLHSGLTLQEPRDADSGAKLLRRSEKRLFINANRPLGRNAHLGVEASYTGPRMDRGDVKLDAYTLVNLSGEYRFSRQWSLSGRIENLLDEEYMLANDYNTPGRSAYAKLNFRM